MTCKISDINSSFHVKQRTIRTHWFLFPKSFLLVLTKFSLSQGIWALGYQSMKFRQLPHISRFPDILSLKLFGNSWGNSYIPGLKVKIPHRFTYGERRILENIEKSRNIIKLIPFKIFFRFYIFLLTAKLVKNRDI